MIGLLVNKDSLTEIAGFDMAGEYRQLDQQIP
jgi:hypothetical protein